MELLYLILDSVKALNVTAQKAVIRSVVNCLLDDGSTLLAKDKTRCLFVLLQNPLFVSQSTYTILAHLLQQVRRPSDCWPNQIYVGHIVCPCDRHIGNKDQGRC